MRRKTKAAALPGAAAFVFYTGARRRSAGNLAGTALFRQNVLARFSDAFSLRRVFLFMVRIRLRRTGAKNDPTFRIVVADQKAPRDGAFIETLGHYLPTRNPHVLEIDADKAREWIRKGAQPSDTAASLLKQKGILNSQGKLATEESEAPSEAPSEASAAAEVPASA